MKGRKQFIVCMLLLFFTFSFIGVHKIIAEEVEFSGTTAPLNVNVREEKSLNANIVDVIPGNTKASFKGWEYGEAVKDYWTGNLDNRWFYYFKDGKKYMERQLILMGILQIYQQIVNYLFLTYYKKDQIGVGRALRFQF